MDKLKETYNIHKKINCIFPFFKSKLLCKMGVHNFQLCSLSQIKKVVYQDSCYGWTDIKYIQENKIFLECKCCKKIEKFE